MKLLRWLAAILAAIAILWVAGWWTHRPLARAPLLDGGEFFLVEMRYGSSVRVEEPIGIWAPIRHFFSSERNTPLKRSVLDHNDPKGPPKLWLIFDHRGGGHWSDGTINSVATLDTTAPEPEELDDRITLFDAFATRKQYLVVGLSNFPRRLPQLHVRVNLNNGRGAGHNVDFTVPNSFQVTDAPTWTPAPIPQSRKFKYGELELRDFQQNVHVVEPAFEIRNSAAPLSAFDVKYEFRDATGNTSEYLLPPSERTWSLHCTVAPNGKYPFSSSDAVLSARTTMPGPGEYRLLPLPTDLVTEPYRNAVLIGSGQYRLGLKDGLTIETVSPRPSGKAVRWGGLGSPIDCYSLELLVIKPDAQGSAGIRPAKCPWIVRIAYADQATAADSGSFYSMGLAWRFDIGNAYKNNGPPPGAKLEIQFIPMVEESVDFFFEAPQRAFR